MHSAIDMRWTVHRPMSLIALATALAACMESGVGPPPDAARHPPPLRPDDASVALAGARCDHEAVCSDVGNGHSYTTRDVCVEQVQQSVLHDLGRCSIGVDPHKLTVCESLLRNESCHPLSTLSRMIACRTEALCVAPPTPGSTDPSFTSEDVYGLYVSPRVTETGRTSS